MNEPSPRPGTSRKVRVAVVFGGRSSEHAISCVTAGSVLQAIDREQYDVVPIGIATDGRWVLESGDPDTLADRRSRPAARASTASAPRIALAPDTSRTELVVTEPLAAAAHAGRGRRGLPAAARSVGRGRHHPGDARDGGGPLRRRRRARVRGGMDKVYMKVVLADAGLPVMPSITVTARPGPLTRPAAAPGPPSSATRSSSSPPVVAPASASPRRTTPPSSTPASTRRCCTTPR